jgi:glycosyltransferase involved in cell wall biosynthesis
MRFVQRLYGDDMLIDMESVLGRPCGCEELATVADAAILTGENAVAPLPVCICMAAGLPMVSTVTYTYSEMLEDNHTALMVGKATATKLANRMLDLQRNRDLRSRLGNAARTEAYEFFSLSQFLSQWRTAYRGLAKDGRIDLSGGQAARAYSAALTPGLQRIV